MHSAHIYARAQQLTQRYSVIVRDLPWCTALSNIDRGRVTSQESLQEQLAFVPPIVADLIRNKTSTAMQQMSQSLANSTGDTSNLGTIGSSSPGWVPAWTRTVVICTTVTLYVAYLKRSRVRVFWAALWMENLALILLLAAYEMNFFRSIVLHDKPIVVGDLHKQLIQQLSAMISDNSILQARDRRRAIIWWGIKRGLACWLGFLLIFDGARAGAKLQERHL